MLNHKGTKIIETERLKLRKFNENDYRNAYKNWTSRDNVSRYMPWKTHKNEIETKKIIDEWIRCYKNNDYYNWVIELKETKEVIGNISIPRKNDDIFCCEVGYCLSDDYWNNGIMTEALKAVINYMFNEINYNRIECTHKIMNLSSGKVMKKSGMRYEGTLREKSKTNTNELVDIMIYSILRKEYNNEVQ